jgi:hypothetical protein
LFGELSKDGQIPEMCRLIDIQIAVSKSTENKFESVFFRIAQG